MIDALRLLEDLQRLPGELEVGQGERWKGMADIATPCTRSTALRRTRGARVRPTILGE